MIFQEQWCQIRASDSRDSTGKTNFLKNLETDCPRSIYSRMIQSIKAVRSTVFQFALSPPSTIPSLCGSLGSRELCREHAGRWPPSPWSRKSGSALPQKLHCKGAVLIMPIETFMCVCVSFTHEPCPQSWSPMGTSIHGVYFHLNWIKVWPFCTCFSL